MSLKTKGLQPSDVFKWFVDDNGMRFCMAKVTLEANGSETADVEPGTLLELFSTKYRKVATGANAAAIFYGPEAVPVAVHKAGDVSIVVAIRGPLVYDSDRVTVAGAQKAAALTALLAKGMVAYTEPTKYNEGTP